MFVLVPRSVNFTGKRDSAGHDKTTVHKLGIITDISNVYSNNKVTSA